MTSGQLPDELEAARCFEMSQPTRSPFPGKKIIRKLIKQNIKNFNISCLKGILELSKPIRLYFFETELSEI
jgi:hypothetical protein